MWGKKAKRIVLEAHLAWLGSDKPLFRLANACLLVGPACKWASQQTFCALSRSGGGYTTH
jgi:hypothetical protein